MIRTSVKFCVHSALAVTLLFLSSLSSFVMFHIFPLSLFLILFSFRPTLGVFVLLTKTVLHLARQNKRETLNTPLVPMHSTNWLVRKIDRQTDRQKDTISSLICPFQNIKSFLMRSINQETPKLVLRHAHICGSYIPEQDN